MTCSLKTKNENLELGTCGINDPWFYREVRCESGAETSSAEILVFSTRKAEQAVL